MSRVNRGKDFENAIYDAFCKIPGMTIDRLPDPMAGFAGVRNICDYFGYKYPKAYYIECKSCYGNTLPFTNITDNQWKGLLEKSEIPGVVAGYMIWFIDHDKTYFIDAQSMYNLRYRGAKSVNVRHMDELIAYWQIAGKKKRIMFSYDLTDFIQNYSEDIKWELLN